MADGAQRLHARIDSAQTGAGELSTGIVKAGGGVAQLDTGLQQLSTGSGKLVAGADKLDDGLGSLTAGAQKLHTGLADGVERIPALNDDQAEGAAQVLAAPADVRTVVDNPAKVYGRGIAPMMLSIAVWVFGVSGFMVMRPISGRLLAGRQHPLLLTLSAYLPVAMVGTLGSLLTLGIVWVTLGLEPEHGAAAVLLVVVTAIAFSLIAHTMRMALGLPGSALLLVLLILQLSSTGGTYPADVLPPFFQWISPFMPITYTIDAFRIVISSGLWSHFLRDLGVLLVICVTTLGLDVLAVAGRQRFAMKDLHPAL